MSSTTTPVPAAADGNISVAMSDIDRYEKQNLNHPATIKRTLKMLPLVKDRLDKSNNKDHPSWEFAMNRYTTLMIRLQGDGGGGGGGSLKVVASPPPVATKSESLPSYEKVRVDKLIRDIKSSNDMLVQFVNQKSRRAGDSTLEIAQRNLTRFQSQLLPFTQKYASESVVEQAAKDYESFRVALSQAAASTAESLVPQPPHPQVKRQGVDEKKDDENAAPQTKVADTAGNAAAVATTVPVTMISQDRARIKKLFRDIDSAKDQIDYKRLDDPNYMQRLFDQARRLTQTLDKYVQRFPTDEDVLASNSALDQYKVAVFAAKEESERRAKEAGVSAFPPDPSVPQMISQERARLLKVKQEIKSAQWSLNQDGPKPFQLPSYAAKQEYVLQTLEDKASKYIDKFPDDRDVKDTVAVLETLTNSIQTNKEIAQKELQELGDVQTQLGDIKSSIFKPNPPSTPYKGDSIQEFVLKVRELEQRSPALLRKLDLFQSRAYLPNNNGEVEYSMNTVKSMRWDIEDALSSVKREMSILKVSMDSIETHIKSTLSFFDKQNPNDRHDQANVFLNESNGGKDHFLKRFDDSQREAEAALAFYSNCGGDDGTTNTEAYTNLLQRIELTRQTFLEGCDIAKAAVRMPNEITPQDYSIEELKQIANDTLSLPKYEIDTTQIRRLVLNSDRKSKEREESEVDFNDVDVSLSGKVTLSGTKTTTRWEWEEFQVATAEVEEQNDIKKCYIYYTTLKFFTKGATTTPLNNWVIGNRFKSVEIQLENVKL